MLNLYSREELKKLNVDSKYNSYTFINKYIKKKIKENIELYDYDGESYIYYINNTNIVCD
jgi:hypothetical protein